MTSAAQRELAGRIRADQQVWRDLVAEMGPERMLEPGPMGDWTFKDLAAHLAAWRNVGSRCSRRSVAASQSRRRHGLPRWTTTTRSMTATTRRFTQER